MTPQKSQSVEEKNFLLVEQRGRSWSSNVSLSAIRFRLPDIYLKDNERVEVIN